MQLILYIYKDVEGAETEKISFNKTQNEYLNAARAHF